MSEDTEAKELISLIVEKAREIERIRILNIIELASYRYDSVTVNNFVADVLGQITDLDDD